MRIGICVPPPSRELASALGSAGCDYYEPPVATTIMAADAGSFEADLGSWTVGALSPRSANVLLPDEVKVVGDEVDTDAAPSSAAGQTWRVRHRGLWIPSGALPGKPASDDYRRTPGKGNAIGSRLGPPRRSL